MNVDLVDNTNEDIKNFVKNLYKTLQQKALDEELATYKISESYYLKAYGNNLEAHETNYVGGNAEWCNDHWYPRISGLDYMTLEERPKIFNITNNADSVTLGRYPKPSTTWRNDCVRILDFRYDFVFNCGHKHGSAFMGSSNVGLRPGYASKVELLLEKSLKYGIKKINNSHNKYQAFISKEGTFTDPVNIKLNRKFHYKRKKEKLQNIEKLLNKESEDNAFIFFVKDKLKELCGEVNLLYKKPFSLNEEYKDFNQENKEYNVSIAKQNIKLLSDALDGWGNMFNDSRNNEYDKYLFRIHLNMSLEHDRNQTLIVSMFYDNDLLLEFEAVGNLDFSIKERSNTKFYSMQVHCQKDTALFKGSSWLNWKIEGLGDEGKFSGSADGNIWNVNDWLEASNNKFRDFLMNKAPNFLNVTLSKPTANTNVTIKKLKINNFYGLDCVSFIKEVFCDNSTTVINGIKNNIKVV